MGGMGSGRYYRARNAPIDEDYLSIDLRKFKQRGWLQYSGWQSLSWFSRNEKTASIQYRITDNAMLLMYRSRLNGQDWQSIEDQISLVKTPCHLGGFRCWFKCSQCSGKVLVLYAKGHYFRCRKCTGIKHASLNESKLDRATRSLKRYQKKLDADRYSLTVLDGVTGLPKPKGMRYKTYHRIYGKALRKQHEVNQLMIEAFGISYW